MAASDLTAARLRELLHYDPATGVFTWRVTRWGRRSAQPGDPAGSLHKTSGYVRIWVDHHTHLAHRLAWLYMTGAWPVTLLDHVNLDRSDNRFANLREASAEVNQHNKRVPRKGTTSRYLGVWFNKRMRKWVTGITAYGVRRHIGTFATEEAAHAAYEEAKRQYHPDAFVTERT